MPEAYGHRSAATTHITPEMAKTTAAALASLVASFRLRSILSHSLIPEVYACRLSGSYGIHCVIRLELRKPNHVA